MRWQMSQVAAHADPRPPVHAEGRFALPDGPQPGGDFSVLEHPEPASDVVRRVPWHVSERRQGERGNSSGRRLLSRVIKQGPAQPPPSVTRIDRYLLDVHAAVNHIGDDKPRRPVIRAGYYPQAAFSPARCERLWMPEHPAHLRPAHLGEHLPRCPVDLLDRGKLSHPATANKHVFSIAAQSPPSDIGHTALSMLSDYLCCGRSALEQEPDDLGPGPISWQIDVQVSRSGLAAVGALELRKRWLSVG